MRISLYNAITFPKRVLSWHIPSTLSGSLFKIYKVFCFYLLASKGFGTANSASSGSSIEPIRFSDNFHVFAYPGFVLNNKLDGACSLDDGLVLPHTCQWITDIARRSVTKDETYEKERLQNVLEKKCPKGGIFTKIKLCIDPQNAKHFKTAIDHLNSVIKDPNIFRDKNRLKENILFTHAILTQKERNLNDIFLSGHLRKEVLFKPDYQYLTINEWKQAYKGNEKLILFRTIEKMIEKKELFQEELEILKKYELILPSENALNIIFDDLLIDICENMQDILSNDTDPLNLAGFVYFKIWHTQMFSKQSDTVAFLWMNTILLAAGKEELIFPDGDELRDVLLQNRQNPNKIKFIEYLHTTVRPWNEKSQVLDRAADVFFYY